jgi:S-adenosylmethionine:tRNA ribosyltransferase-isomerase
MRSRSRCSVVRGEFYRLRFPGDAADLIERHGRLPLPPYIERMAAAGDETRYQTVFAREKGSVAAPTAGLHFDHELLALLRETGVAIAHVTLHVGAGTFQPVRTENLAEHRMHTERYTVPAATVEAYRDPRRRRSHRRGGHDHVARAGRRGGGGRSESRRWRDGDVHHAGLRFRVVDSLITNFHLPKSTLLMLVSAFGGLEPLRAAYRHAIAERYRFFSYGDAMLLHRRTAG